MNKKWIEPQPITPEVDEALKEYPKTIRQTYSTGGCQMRHPLKNS